MYGLKFILDIHDCTLNIFIHDIYNCLTPVLGLGLGVDFTFAWDNKNNNNNNNKKKNPHLNFLKRNSTRG